MIGDLIYEWAFIVLLLGAVAGIVVDVSTVWKEKGAWWKGLLVAISTAVTYSVYASTIWFLYSIWVITSENYHTLTKFSKIVFGV